MAALARCRLWLAVAALGWACSGLAQPHACHPDCTKKGNCNTDSGECLCPYGFLGPACEIDALSACRIDPDSPAICGGENTLSCACVRQCTEYHCSDGQAARECGRFIPSDDSGCYMREGVPDEKQYSLVPEEGEAGVKYYKSWRKGAPEATTKEEILKVVQRGDRQTLPPSACNPPCKYGYCNIYYKGENSKPYCACHRGWGGGACDEEDTKWCHLGCSGRGKCHDYFCHCDQGSFGFGCWRNSTVPADKRAKGPSPADFKIYMYELTYRNSWPLLHDIGWPRSEEGMGLYSAYIPFYLQLVASPYVTTDPEEAHMFLVPAYSTHWTGASQDLVPHFNQLLEEVSQKYPYWNRTGGRDHFFFAGADRGSCHLYGLSALAVKLSHFGYYLPDPKNSTANTIRQRGTPGWSCHLPQRDVQVPSLDRYLGGWAERNANLTLDAIIANKTKLFFFHGGTHDPTGDMSGNSRQILDRLEQEWNDPEFVLDIKGREKRALDVNNWEYGYREAKFCFVPYGWGFGNRLPQAMFGNCIPVIVQEHVYQAFEDVLPYEEFSIRLNNEDLPQLREILRGVSAERYRQMMQALIRYRDAFSWMHEQGGKAFEYSILSLRRRYMNMKAMHY